MIHNLVFLDDALQELTDQDLYPVEVEDGVLSATLVRERGTRPSFTVQMAHPGWEIYDADAKRAAALVTSEDGTLATAKVHARGWLHALPPGLTGDELTLTFECAADDVEDRMEAEANRVINQGINDPVYATAAFPQDPSTRGAPFRDLLFGRMSKLSDEVLLARSAWWRHDPCTHEPTVVTDRAPPRRVHNIGDGYDPASLQVDPGDGPVAEVTMTLSVNVNQAARGVTNLAPVITPFTSLAGYKSQAPVSLGANAGWQIGASGTPLMETKKSATEIFLSGREWEMVTRQIYYVRETYPNGTVVTNTTYGNERKEIYFEDMQLEVTHYTMLYWGAAWTYNQTRSETIKLTLQIPTQNVRGIKPTLDLGTMQLQNLYAPILDNAGADEGAEDPYQGEYQEGTDFKAGMLSMYAGKIYQALVDDPGPIFTTKLEKLQVVTAKNPMWVDTGIQAPVSDTSIASFFDTGRGQLAVTHGFLRMAKAGLERLGSYRATFTVEREYLPDVELEDEILFLLPARHDQPGKPCLGVVQRIEETWSGEGDTVTVTLSVSLGTGLDDVADVGQIGSGYVDDEYLADDDYLARDTGQRVASPQVIFATTAGPLVQHVDVRRLDDPTYALRLIAITGQADEQLADAKARAASSRDPAPGSSGERSPTTIAIGLVPLVSERNIHRDYEATGQLLYSRRGLDLAA